MLDFYQSFLCMLNLPVPIIAAVNGHAIGAGFALALACDARVISTTAKLGLNFSRLGLHPGMGATLFLPRLAPRGVASDLLIAGRIIDAEAALQYGLANLIIEANEVLPEATRLAESYRSSAPDAVSGLLSTIRPAANEIQATLEREAAEQARNFTGPEFQEGMAAAVEKRRPNF